MFHRMRIIYAVFDLNIYVSCPVYLSITFFWNGQDQV